MSNDVEAVARSCVVVARGKRYLVDYRDGAPERIYLITSLNGDNSWSRQYTRTIWRKGQRTQTPRVCSVFVAFNAEMKARAQQSADTKQADCMEDKSEDV